MKTCTLSSEELSICVLPEIGGAITQGYFHDLAFLAQPPRAGKEPKALGSESDWVAAWHGGWQPLLPNAGGEYLQGEFPQGFHGNGSQAPWHIVHQTNHSIDLEWVAEKLQCGRSMYVDGNQIRVTGSLLNNDSKSRSVIITEHLVLGTDFLDTPISVYPNDGARFRELDYDGLSGGRGFLPWSEFQNKDWDSLSVNTPARMGVFSDLGEMKVANDDYEIHISWDALNLPFLWLWEEMGSTTIEPWNGEYFALGIEPSTAPDGHGISGGCATVLPSKMSINWWVTLEIQKRARK